MVDPQGQAMKWIKNMEIEKVRGQTNVVNKHLQLEKILENIQ